MNAAELIAKLSALPGDTEILVGERGCSCCAQLDEEPAVLARRDPDQAVMIVGESELDG